MDDYSEEGINKQTDKGINKQKDEGNDKQTCSNMYLGHTESK